MVLMTTRTQVRPERTAEVEAAARRLFAAISEARPRNLRLFSSKLSDGVTFLTVLQVEEGTENPLPALPAYLEFQRTLQGAVAGPPVADRLTLVGACGLFGG